MQDVYKVCPDCGEEFQARVEVCPDCGVALGWSTDSVPDSSGARGSDPSQLEPSPELVLVNWGDLDWVRGLAGRLGRAGIPSFTSIVADPSLTSEQLGTVNFHHDGRYYLFVRREDFDAGREMDQAHLAEKIGGAEGWGGLPTAQSGTCPACGAYLTEDADECPSCELSFRWPAEDEESEVQEG